MEGCLNTDIFLSTQSTAFTFQEVYLMIKLYFSNISQLDAKKKCHASWRKFYQKLCPWLAA